ncbi:MAG: Ig domain-containing protein [bacterium]|nr:Ig domain-containing protein [bacterium]
MNKSLLSSIILATLFVVVGMLAGCGGGGGGGSPITATANTTAQNLTVGQPMTSVSLLSANGGATPYVHSYTGTLPSGLVFNTSTGKVSGTPTAPYSTANLVFSVKDANNVVASTTSTVSFTVTTAPTYTVSGCVTGGVQAGVTITVNPGNHVTTTATDGCWSLGGFVNNTYTATPTEASNPTFSPPSIQVTVNGMNVTDVDFTTPVPVRSTGKLLYPCQQAFCSMDLSTGTITTIWGGNQCWWDGCSIAYPDTIVPYRNSNSVAIIGSNIQRIHGMYLPTLTQTGWVEGQGSLAPNCPSWPADHPKVSFDISPQGDFAVMASNCSPPGDVARKDIFIVLMDGSNYWARVTNDVEADSQPVIGGVDATTGYVTVLFVRNGTEIRKQVSDPANDLLIGYQSIIASNVMTGVRSMSVNAAYTHLAFMKNVGGVSHITIVPLAGGAEVDLGVGTDPYWTLDGSNLILYTADNALWVMNPDGTGKMSVPTPSNLQYGLGKAVFGPPGF